MRSKCSAVIYGRPVRNYFKTDFKKTALISYISRPFHAGPSAAHTNGVEALAMAETLKDLEFNVDVYNYNHQGPADYVEYGLIIGFGEPLINSYYKSKAAIPAVYYGTGMHVAYQNHSTLARVKEVYLKKGVWLPESGRIVDKAWSVQTTLVDAIITLGNDTVIASYRKYFNGPIFNIPVTYHTIQDPAAAENLTANRDYSTAKKSFIWFGGAGLVHKGLDLLLEVFKELPGFTLHVCGSLEHEQRFVSAYNNELRNTANIHAHGFVDARSGLLRQLIRGSAFCLFPSCSEGEPSSVITLMANGVVPVVPDTAGIKIKEFGLRIGELSADAVRRAVQAAASLPDWEVRGRALETLKDTRGAHSVPAYKAALKKSLREIIKT